MGYSSRAAGSLVVLGGAQVEEMHGVPEALTTQMRLDLLELHVARGRMLCQALGRARCLLDHAVVVCDGNVGLERLVLCYVMHLEVKSVGCGAHLVSVVALGQPIRQLMPYISHIEARVGV